MDGNRNVIVTDDWSNPASRALYEARWRSEPGCQAAYHEGRQCGGCSFYVAFDADSVEPGELEVFMPEPDGLRLRQVEEVFGEIRDRSPVLGAGVTALAPAKRNVEPVTRLLAALNL